MTPSTLYTQTDDPAGEYGRRKTLGYAWQRGPGHDNAVAGCSEDAGRVESFGIHLAPDRVDFKVKAGQVHALLGENGAGKSTLIRILTGVYYPDAGQVLMDGARVDAHASPTVSARCTRRATC